MSLATPMKIISCSLPLSLVVNTLYGGRTKSDQKSLKDIAIHRKYCGTNQHQTLIVCDGDIGRRNANPKLGKQ